MKRENKTPSILIATLGTEPQVVTAIENLLKGQGEAVSHIFVVHTTAPGTTIENAVNTLKEYYQNSPSFSLMPLYDNWGHFYADVENSSAVETAFRLLYRLIWRGKKEGYRVHLSIAGGRKTLAVLGMVAAQLLFDEDDHLWYLFSGGDFLSSKRLQPLPGDDVHLLEVPVIRWSEMSPAAWQLAQVEDPYEALEKVSRLQYEEKILSARSFVFGVLTAGEERVVRLLVQEGLADAELGSRLNLSSRTVEQHLRSAYEKAAVHWEIEQVNRTQLVALLNLFYNTQITGKPA